MEKKREFLMIKTRMVMQSRYSKDLKMASTLRFAQGEKHNRSIWLFDSKGTSICLMLIYALKIGNHVYCTSLLTRLIGQVGRVFGNGLGNLGSILGWVIPKTLKIVLDTFSLNTQQYKVRIDGKVEQSKEWSSALPIHRCSSYWKGSFRVTLD